MTEERLRQIEELAHMWKGTAIESALTPLIAEVRSCWGEIAGLVEECKERERRERALEQEKMESERARIEEVSMWPRKIGNLEARLAALEATLKGAAFPIYDEAGRQIEVRVIPGAEEKRTPDSGEHEERGPR